MSESHLNENARQEAKAVSSRMSKLLDAIAGDSCGFVLIWTKSNGMGGTQIAYSTNLDSHDAKGVMCDVIDRVESGHVERTSGGSDS